MQEQARDSPRSSVRLSSFVARMAAARPVVLAALVVLGIGAGALLLFSTPYGIGISSDSVAYIAGANNLRAGRGVSESMGGDEVKPITHWPPFYSISLAGIEALGLGQEAAARWLEVVLFAANVLVGGLAAWALTGSGLMAVAGAWAILMSASLIFLHSAAMSDPLYLLLSLAGLLVLSSYVGRGHPGALLGASALISLAFLTRYAGFSAVLAGTICMLALRRGAWRQRLRDTTIFLSITLAPMAAWLIRNALVSGTTTNRSLGFNPVSPAVLKIPFSLVWRTVLPIEFSYPALWAMVVILVALPALILLTGRWRRVVPWLRGFIEPLSGLVLLKLLVVYSVAYSTVLAATVLFFDASTPLDDRLMSPLIELILLLAVAFGFALWRRLARRVTLQALVAVAGLALLLSYPVESANTVRLLRINGGGYAHRGFLSLPMLQAVRELPPGIIIYTNEPELVYFHTGRGAYSLPIKYDSVTGRAKDYATGLDRMRQDMRARGGVLVLFDSIFRQNTFPSREALVQGMLTLREVYGGAIFGYSRLPSPLSAPFGIERLGVIQPAMGWERPT